MTLSRLELVLLLHVHTQIPRYFMYMLSKLMLGCLGFPTPPGLIVSADADDDGGRGQRRGAAGTCF
jgi:hypothetical protein